MTWIRPVTGLAAIALFGACGAVPQTEGAPVATADTLVEMSTTSTPADRTLAPGTTPVATDDSGGSTEPNSDHVADSQALPAPTTTVTTHVTTTSTDTTTTTPAPTIDIQGVLDALDALDAVLGDFDSQVGVIDLDEDEGETP